MVFGLMKFITWLLSPLVIGVIGMEVGARWGWRGQARRGLAAFVSSFVWLWVLSSPWSFLILGGTLCAGELAPDRFPALLYTSEDAQKIQRYDESGQVAWEYPAQTARDVWQLPNGNVLFP